MKFSPGGWLANNQHPPVRAGRINGLLIGAELALFVSSLQEVAQSSDSILIARVVIHRSWSR